MTIGFDPDIERDIYGYNSDQDDEEVRDPYGEPFDDAPDEEDPELFDGD